eukprot:TRINITY_DN11807_c0_g1_i1.p1 TRINITY_DN11807_c0_g1~~TRINITY_DN11807_c0_g1_i1.p1  ORF type:complete len:258 (+),score=44.53 TRINITY_DN11807_c0_g1_i1:59-775(+)
MAAEAQSGQQRKGRLPPYPDAVEPRHRWIRKRHPENHQNIPSAPPALYLGAAQLRPEKAHVPQTARASSLADGCVEPRRPSTARPQGRVCTPSVPGGSGARVPAPPRHGGRTAAWVREQSELQTVPPPPPARRQKPDERQPVQQMRGYRRLWWGLVDHRAVRKSTYDSFLDDEARRRAATPRPDEVHRKPRCTVSETVMSLRPTTPTTTIARLGRPLLSVDGCYGDYSGWRHFFHARQ